MNASERLNTVGPDDLADLVAALRAVLAGHESEACTDNPRDAVQERCASDDQPWPCDLVRSIDAHLGGIR